MLVVDDDESVLHVYRRCLSGLGYEVRCATDGNEADEQLRSHSFDAVVSDIFMPGMDGIQLLRRVREYDLDVPVVLLTGMPDVETATRAVEYGALRYLPKPVDLRSLQEVTAYAVNVHDLAKKKREALAALGEAICYPSDRAGMEASFERALALLHMMYQPIVQSSTGEVAGCEALVCSGDPVLSEPKKLLEIAERLGRTDDLGRSIRRRVADAASRLDANKLIFIKIHQLDLGDDDLYSKKAALSRHAARVVLEITEGAHLGGVGNVPRRMRRLRSLGYRVAVDDLGAGYAGLNSFVQMSPEFVKIGSTLTRRIDRDPRRQDLLRSLLRGFHELDVRVVVEGVETEQEQATLQELGVDLLQGYLIGAPSESFLETSGLEISGDRARGCSGS